MQQLAKHCTIMQQSSTLVNIAMQKNSSINATENPKSCQSTFVSANAATR
jgi:hypothetical protein